MSKTAPTLIKARTGYSDEWYTPQWLFDRLHSHFVFTLDPASCKTADKGIRYITKEENGLTVSWANERIFCNPPFSLSKHFLAKVDEITMPSVILVPARIETKYWFEHVWPKANEIFVLKGRLQYFNAEGVKGEATFPSVLLAYGGASFVGLEDLGVILKPLVSSPPIPQGDVPKA